MFKSRPVTISIDELDSQKSNAQSIEVDTTHSKENPTMLIMKMGRIQQEARQHGVAVRFSVTDAMMGFIDLTGCKATIKHIKASHVM
jgi:hypothetical protein